MIRESILRMVREAFPSLVYGHPRTYVVVAVDAEGRLDLEPPGDAPYLPALRAVGQWAVATMVPEVGAEVTVLFRDANPARPIVIGAKGGAGEQFITPAGVIGSPPPFAPLPAAAGRVVRYGDSVIMPVGTVGNGASAFMVPGPVAGAFVSRVKG